jgi:hypothetical protein
MAVFVVKAGKSAGGPASLNKRIFKFVPKIISEEHNKIERLLVSDGTDRGLKQSIVSVLTQNR